MTFFNSSSIEISINDNNNWAKDTPELLHLIWNTTSFNDSRLEIQLNFTHPVSISPNKI